MNGWKTNGKLNEEWRKGHVSTCDSITKVHREAPFAWGSILFPDVTGKGFTGCRGPAPAGSRGTLRMNGIGEWERQWDKAQGWVWSLFSHGPFIPLTTSFWGKCILLTHRSSQNITATWPSTETGCHPHTFSFTGVFLIIWPSGLLTFYGLYLVWLKQLQ